MDHCLSDGIVRATEARRAPRSMGAFIVLGCILPLSLCLGWTIASVTPGLAGVEDPVLVSSTLWSDARAVRVIDETAIALFTRGMATFDVSDPTMPVLLERFDHFDDPWAYMAIEVVGKLAYVAAGVEGLKVYDFSDPTQPVLAGECDTPGDAYNLTIVGELAFIADGYDGGLQIVEISDPSAPQLLGGCDTPGGCWAVAVTDEYAYSAEGMSGIAIIDVTDPHNPQLESVVHNTYYPPWEIRVEGHYLYTLGGEGSKSTWDPSGMVIHDITDPTALVFRGVYYSDQGTNSLAIRGHLAYIANANGTVSVVDVSDASAPAEVAEVVTEGYSTDICLVEDRAYVSASGGCLAVLDLSVPTLPVLIGHWWESSNSYDVSTRDGLVCVADRSFGLHVVDASKPEDPHVLSHLALPDGPLAVVTDGCHAYVADGSAGVLVVDVMDPNLPIIVGQVGVVASDLDFDGRYLYAVGQNDDLNVIDVIDPQNPLLIGSLDLPGSSWSISVSGSYGCVTTGASLLVVDLVDLAHPVLRGVYDPWEYVHQVSFDGTYAYASLGNDGLFVIDVSDPDAPSYVTELHFGANTRGSCLNGDRLYLGAAGLQVIDVSDPRNPSVVGSAPTTGTRHACIDDGLAFTADGGSLAIFRVGPTTAAGESHLVRPAGAPQLVLENPVCGAAEVLIWMAREDRIRLEVLDVRGRRAALLHDGMIAEGELRLQWNVATLPAGRYYLRASTPFGRTTRSILVLR